MNEKWIYSGYVADLNNKHILEAYSESLLNCQWQIHLQKRNRIFKRFVNTSWPLDKSSWGKKFRFYFHANEIDKTTISMDFLWKKESDDVDASYVDFHWQKNGKNIRPRFVVIWLYENWKDIYNEKQIYANFSRLFYCNH